MSWIEELADFWHYFLGALTVLMALVASGHALLYKRDTRGAVLWVGFIGLVPLVGAMLYFMLGINRIKRRASFLRGSQERYRVAPNVNPCLAEELEVRLPARSAHLAGLGRMIDKVVMRPLLPGNRVEALLNGDAAFPAMLEAIGRARKSVTLSTYIFDRDRAGLAFAQALGAAARRGVEVRVLIDATGTRYSWPTILGVLRREGVVYGRFLPAFRLRRLFSLNLRNHRKVLVIDGSTGFTGGINVREGNWLIKQPRHPVQDVHFRIEGPVVAHLQETFADDWYFTTGETLRGEAWFPELRSCGSVLARGIADGPDEDFEKLRWAILGALASAKHRIRIVTPYFLPDASIISALNLAAMRGVEVDILLPNSNNLPFVHWASVAHWWQILEHGCRIWLTPPPFDHTKIFVVDNFWVSVGSSNWDPRSLRLNFEFNLECYDGDLAERLDRLVTMKQTVARRVTLAEVDGRNLAVRLRDGIARLFTPFL